MSPLFDRLEDQLRDAARQRVAAREAGAPSRGRAQRVRRWLARGGRALPIGLALATTIAVVAAVVVVVALHGGGGGGSPVSGAPATGAQRRQAAALIVGRAIEPVLRSRVCDAEPRDGETLPGRPSRALRDELTVLQRPRTAADRVPLATRLAVGSPVYASAIRRARVVDGADYYVVPIRFDATSQQPTATCLNAEAAAVRRKARTLSSAQGREALRLEDESLAAERKRLDAPTVDEACLSVVGGRGIPLADSCAGMTAAEIKTGTFPELISGHGYRAIVALEPEDVARVTVAYPKDHESFTGDVRHNVLVISIRARHPDTDDETVTSYKPDGQKLSVSRSGPAPDCTANATCRRAAASSGVVSASTSTSTSTTPALKAPPQR